VSLPARNPDEPSDVDHARWFAEEVQPHEPALRGYLRSRFPSLEIDDVVQESYRRLWKLRHTGKVTSAKAYFFTVARNTALTLFRRRRIFSSVPVNELPEWRVLDGGPDAAETANEHLRRALAVEAIAQLPSRCQEICRLAAWERMSPIDIAKQLGIAESTVHVQLARAIVKCAAYLRARGE
jgi:RNA polymerase sigma factor (sigma-70 family)